MDDLNESASVLSTPLALAQDLEVLGALIWQNGQVKKEPKVNPRAMPKQLIKEDFLVEVGRVWRRPVSHLFFLVSTCFRWELPEGRGHVWVSGPSPAQPPWSCACGPHCQLPTVTHDS